MKGRETTRPPGPRTGVAGHRCYAAPLADCGGKLASREHYLSRGLLRRIERHDGVVDGLAWHDGPRVVNEQEHAPRVLCQRHNSALQPLDFEICRLFDVLHAATRGRAADITIDGDAIQLWGLKLLFGMGASRNICRKDGARVHVRPGPAGLRTLFGEAQFPDGPGFHVFVPRVIDHPECQVVVTPESREPNVIVGIRVRMFGLTWVTSLAPLVGDGVEPLVFRPEHVLLDPQVRIRFLWTGRSSPIGVDLRTRRL